MEISGQWAPCVEIGSRMSRHGYRIEKAVAQRGSVSISELAQMLGVSDQTIRRSVKPLVAEGRLRKVHGAIESAQSAVYAPFLERLDHMRPEKLRIAAHLASMIPDAASLAIDAGSTSGLLAQALRTKRDLRIVTNSAFVAATLSMRPGNRVFMAGSRLRDHDGAAFDAATFTTISRMQTEYAVLSASAVCPKRGFLVHEACEADVAQAMSDIADRTVMCVDHSKFALDETQHMFLAMPPRQVDLLITDRDPGCIPALENTEIAVADHAPMSS